MKIRSINSVKARTLSAKADTPNEMRVYLPYADIGARTSGDWLKIYQSMLTDFNLGG